LRIADWGLVGSIVRAVRPEPTRITESSAWHGRVEPNQSPSAICNSSTFFPLRHPAHRRLPAPFAIANHDHSRTSHSSQKPAAFHCCGVAADGGPAIGKRAHFDCVKRHVLSLKRNERRFVKMTRKIVHLASNSQAIRRVRGIVLIRKARTGFIQPKQRADGRSE
jgi:hypothetical protein